MRITFAIRNGPNDGLPRDSAHLAQHVGQLNVHLRQRLLHPLDVSPCRLHEIVALAPVGAGGTAT